MSNFTKELIALINKYSEENKSDTPDFILAQFVYSCLKAFNVATLERDAWYDKKERTS